MLEFIGSRIHLCNHDVTSVFELLSELLINGNQLFAVTTPWGVELDEDILLLVKCDFIKVGADKSIDRCSIPVGGQFLREQMLLNIQDYKYGH